MVLMYDSEYDTEQVHEMVVHFHQDFDATSPREWDDCGRFYSPDRDWAEETVSLYGLAPYELSSEGCDLALREAAAEHASQGDAVVAVQYQDYGSSGARMHVCDSLDYANGLYIIPAAKVRTEWGEHYDTFGVRLEHALAYAKAVVGEFDSYLSGECYGFAIEWQGETLDSCWGFIGDEQYMRHEAIDQAQWWQDVLDARRAELDDRIENARDVDQLLADQRELDALAPEEVDA